MIFVVERLGVVACPECNRRLGRRLSVTSVGMRGVRGAAGVNVRVGFLCPHCGMERTIVKTVDNTLLLSWIVQGIRRPGFSARYTKPVVVTLPPQVKPSRNGKSPKRPISAAEVARARKRLSRTSFKRTSKSWKAFLKRMKGSG